MSTKKLCGTQEICETLKDKRVTMGLTLQDVEKITGISYSYLGQIEKGKIPSKVYAQRILDWVHSDILKLPEASLQAVTISEMERDLLEAFRQLPKGDQHQAVADMHHRIPDGLKTTPAPIVVNG